MQKRKVSLVKVAEDYEKAKKKKEQQQEQQQEIKDRPETQEQQAEQQPEEQAAKPKQQRKVLRLTDKQKSVKGVSEQQGTSPSESEKKTDPAIVSPSGKKTRSEPPATSNDQTVGSRQAPSSKMEKVVGATKKPISQIRSPRPPTKKQKFEDTHHRYTSYLETDLYNTIQRLNKQGDIQSIAAVLNDAVFEYLSTYFPDEIKKKN